MTIPRGTLISGSWNDADVEKSFGELRLLQELRHLVDNPVEGVFLWSKPGSEFPELSGGNGVFYGSLYLSGGVYEGTAWAFQIDFESGQVVDAKFRDPYPTLGGVGSDGEVLKSGRFKGMNLVEVCRLIRSKFYEFDATVLSQFTDSPMLTLQRIRERSENLEKLLLKENEEKDDELKRLEGSILSFIREESIENSSVSEAIHRLTRKILEFPSRMKTMNNRHEGIP